jgi:SNF2 family DNA or RNA helicase
MEHVFNETIKNSKRYEKQFDNVIDYCAKYNVLTSKEARFMKKMIRNNDIKNVDNINRFNFIYNTCYNWLTTHNKEYRNILRQSKISITSAIMKALGEAMGQVYTKRKIQAINDMVSENIDVIIKLIEKAEKKTIIWSSFKKVISKTSELLNAKGIKHVVVTGDTQDSDEVLKQFRLYDDINVLIASQKKLSTGVTLIEANQAIFLDLPYRDADFQQAVDRIHRIGQDTDVYIWKLLLETRKPNIITHANDIMQWSAQMSSIVMGSKQSPIEIEED